MKKIVSFLLVLTFMLALSACGNTQDVNGSCRVVIMGETATQYSVDLSKVEVSEGVFSLLKYLKDNENLTLEFNSGAYGAELTKLGALSPNDNEYICVWTSVSKDFDVSSWAQTTTYDGVSLTTSGLGVSSMTVEDNAVYYFSLVSF